VKQACSTTEMRGIGIGGKTSKPPVGRVRNWLVLGGCLNVCVLGLSIWQMASTPAHAAVARASIGVSTRVVQDCAALLRSSTTIIAASFACRGSTVAVLWSPTVTSTSLAILAPIATSRSGLGGSAASSDGESGTSPGGAPLAPNDSISVRPASNNFVATTDEADDKIVTVTY